MASKKEKALKAANKALQRGQLDKAIREYEKLLDMDSRDPRLHHKYAELLARKGQRDEAFEEFNWVAAYYEQGGFYPKALAVYKQMLGLAPDDRNVHLHLGEIYQQQGKVSDASQHFRKVAEAVDREGTLSERVELHSKLVQANPNDVEQRLKYVSLLVDAGDIDNAAGSLRELADIFRSAGKKDRLLSILDRLANLVPEETDILQEIASLSLENGDTNEALSRLQICFQVNPQDPDVLTMLGQAFKASGQADKAIQVYEELARIHESNEDLDKLDAVEALIDELLPDDEGIIPTEADMRALEPDEIAEPMEFPEQIIDAALTQIVRGETLLNYGLVERAQEVSDVVIEQYPQYFASVYLQARVYEAIEDPQSAASSIMQAYSIAMDSGHLPVARQCLTEGVRLLPGDDSSLGRLNAFDEAMGDALDSWTPDNLRVPSPMETLAAESESSQLMAEEAFPESDPLVPREPYVDEESQPQGSESMFHDEIDVALPDVFTREDVSADEMYSDDEIAVGSESIEEDSALDDLDQDSMEMLSEEELVAELAHGFDVGYAAEEPLEVGNESVEEPIEVESSESEEPALIGHEVQGDWGLDNIEALQYMAEIHDGVDDEDLLRDREADARAAAQLAAEKPEEPEPDEISELKSSGDEDSEDSVSVDESSAGDSSEDESIDDEASDDEGTESEDHELVGAGTELEPAILAEESFDEDTLDSAADSEDDDLDLAPSADEPDELDEVTPELDDPEESSEELEHELDAHELDADDPEIDSTTAPVDDDDDILGSSDLDLSAELVLDRDIDDVDDEFESMLNGLATDIAKEIEEEEYSRPTMDEGEDEASVDAQNVSEIELGLGYLEVGLFEEALHEFQTAIDEMRDVDQAHYYLGKCYVELGQHARAATPLQISLSLLKETDPLVKNAMYDLAAVYEASGAAQAALQLFREVARVHPEFKSEQVGERVASIVDALGITEE